MALLRIETLLVNDPSCTDAWQSRRGIYHMQTSLSRSPKATINANSEYGLLGKDLDFGEKC